MRRSEEGPTEATWWLFPGLQAAVLLLAAVLRLWRLEQNGYDNEYYAAAVRSMSGAWHNFVYVAFDPAGFVSVDKPPVAFWLQVASVKVLGFHGLAVLLPQVLAGVAAVALVLHLVRRQFGPGAGVLAALFLALTPVSVAVDRSNNAESSLVLVILLTVWALTHAAETGRRRWLLLAMLLLGIGFNVKMSAALVVLPTLVLVYWLGAPTTRRQRLGDLALGALVLTVVALSWSIAYDLTPAPHRPFVGSSKHNSMLELAAGHNGVGRFVRVATTPRPGAAGETSSSSATADGAVRRRLSRIFVRAPVGPLRLADGQLAAQAAWLLPLALAGLVGWCFLGQRRGPLGSPELALLLWTGWLVTYAAVYSSIAGMFHFYYLSALAPPLAALAGIGVVVSWRTYVARGRGAALLPLAVLLTTAWQAYIEAMSPGGLFPGPHDWRTWMHVATLAVGLLAAGALVAPLRQTAWTRGVRARSAAVLGLAVLAHLVTPLAWALSSVLARGLPFVPSADVARLAPDDPAGAQAAARALERPFPERLVAFLRANRDGERFLLATSTTRVAAPVIIRTGEAVMALGGFHGLDQIVSPDVLAAMVARREVRFVMQGDLSVVDRYLGAEAAGRPLAEWVRAHGTLVTPELWRQDAAAAGARRRVAPPPGATALYDLAPRPYVVPD
jgi:4-amino-4-deoxy-L-arabinose transferase-like glycosyltransferase